MKRYTLLFVCFVLSMMSVFAVPFPVAAQTPQAEVIMVEEDTSVEATDSVAMNEGIEYELPYPGMLPDHPLYFLKSIRDTIIEQLIVDPVRKTQFYILQADKSLNSGLFLREKGKREMAVSSFVAAESHMQKAVDVLQGMKSAGRTIPASILEHIERSTIKHEEILAGVVDSGEDYQGSEVSASLDAIRQLRSDIESVK